MVYFIGAGPGAPDLITVRGKGLLEKADIIIYAGSLVNPELLNYKKQECEVHNSAMLTLEEVLEIMVLAERDKKEIVRLHTGDPSLYGAIREQMDALDEHGIIYEVCPGVSSMSGAAAALKAEYTLPDVSQTVIISRIEGRTPVPEGMRVADLAKHQATMILFLSTGLLEELERQLLEGGYPENTSAAIVYKATWKDEKILRCTISTLKETAKLHNITKTALILVGEFLGDTYERSKLYDPIFSTEFRTGK